MAVETKEIIITVRVPCTGDREADYLSLLRALGEVAESATEKLDDAYGKEDPQ